MEKAIASSAWSLSWPPPELEKLKQMLTAAARILFKFARGILVLLLEPSPEQQKIDEIRMKTRHYLTPM